MRIDEEKLTVEQIGTRLKQLNRWGQDRNSEFQARIEVVRGCTVLTYVKVPIDETIPDFIRAGGTE